MLAGKLRPNEVPERPWQHISVDFITKLPISKDYDSILVVCNRFSKMSYFVVMTEKTTVEGLAKLFRDNIWKLHRLPESVISDRELQFVAGLMRELNKMLGIETKLSTVLRSISRGYSMELGYRYDDTISCTKVVSVSASCSRYHNPISSSLFPHVL